MTDAPLPPGDKLELRMRGGVKRSERFDVRLTLEERNKLVAYANARQRTATSLIIEWINSLDMKKPPA